MAALALARATEIFGDELLDDLPLRRVGVLRLVDQHMVDFAVELVTHPVAHARRPQQGPCPVDQVVEVGDAGRSLGPGVGSRERLASPQSRGNVRREPRGSLHREQFADPRRDLLGMAVIVRIGLELAGRRLAEVALAGEDHQRQIGKRAGPFRGVHRQPALDLLDDLLSGRRAPGAVRACDRAQQVAIEPIVAAMVPAR